MPSCSKKNDWIIGNYRRINVMKNMIENTPQHKIRFIDTITYTSQTWSYNSYDI